VNLIHFFAEKVVAQVHLVPVTESLMRVGSGLNFGEGGTHSGVKSQVRSSVDIVLSCSLILLFCEI
jgi:hypothetical protein